MDKVITVIDNKGNYHFILVNSEEKIKLGEKIKINGIVESIRDL